MVVYLILKLPGLFNDVHLIYISMGCGLAAWMKAAHEEGIAPMRSPELPFGFAKTLTYILWAGFILSRLGRILKHVYVDHFGHMLNQDYIQAIVLNRNRVRIQVCDHIGHILR
jgi:hypothetical protein